MPDLVVWLRTVSPHWTARLPSCNLELRLLHDSFVVKVLDVHRPISHTLIHCNLGGIGYRVTDACWICAFEARRFLACGESMFFLLPYGVVELFTLLACCEDSAHEGLFGVEHALLCQHAGHVVVRLNRTLL